jgi:peptidoglycan hydrolase CwlO-like protein
MIYQSNLKITRSYYLGWESIVEQLPKYLKNADAQSKIIKQINSSMNQLQRQIGQIQKNIQKKGKQK